MGQIPRSTERISSLPFKIVHDLSCHPMFTTTAIILTVARNFVDPFNCDRVSLVWG